MRHDFKHYFCNECKKHIQSLEEVLLVEKEAPKAFCSERCIEVHYEPFVKFYEEFLSQFFSQDLLDLSLTQSPDQIQDTLSSCDTKVKVVNELGESVAFYLKNYSDQAYSVVICKQFEDHPSFILQHMCTTERREFEDFKKQITDQKRDVSSSSETSMSSESNMRKIEIEPETMKIMDQKKSEQLADLLNLRNDRDIGYEEFPHYEKFLPSTLDGPDEVYSQIDDSGDLYYIYIKAFEEQNESFYYFVLTCEIENKMNSESSDSSEKKRFLFPILSFPSVDKDIYLHYREGEKISGSLKN